MAVAAYAIVTLQEVKDYLKIAGGESDSLLEGWIDRTSYSIESYTGRKFKVQDVSNEIYDGDGTDTLFLRYWPLTQFSTEDSPTDAQKLAAVQYRNAPDGDWTDIDDNASHLLTDSRWPFIKLYDTTFSYGERNVRLSYRAGYSVIPGDVWIVALEMVADFWQKSRQGGEARLGISSQGRESYSTTFLELEPRWRKVLDLYRISQHYSGSSQRIMGR